MAAGTFILAAMLSTAAMFEDDCQKGLGGLLLVVSLLPLGTLLSNDVWIASLGGFPAIGSGQGIIKYFALLAIGLSFALPKYLTTKQLIWINFIPVALVYLWIGGMKFTLIEAKGIEPLVSSSPLLSWLYEVFDLQIASNLIGIYDLLIVVVLALSLWFKRWVGLALLLASTVFVVTQSFFLTWPAAISSDTVLSGGGQFIIKDIWFMVNLLLIYRLTSGKNER
jgi:uncharacterized membrane protein YkgB